MMLGRFVASLDSWIVASLDSWFVGSLVGRAVGVDVAHPTSQPHASKNKIGANTCIGFLLTPRMERNTENSQGHPCFLVSVGQIYADDVYRAPVFSRL